jgi:hypothetical protein
MGQQLLSPCMPPPNLLRHPGVRINRVLGTYLDHQVAELLAPNLTAESPHLRLRRFSPRTSQRPQLDVSALNGVLATSHIPTHEKLLPFGHLPLLKSFLQYLNLFSYLTQYVPHNYSCKVILILRLNSHSLLWWSIFLTTPIPLN